MELLKFIDNLPVHVFLLMNRSLDDEIVTLFMMPHERYTHISSSLIKEVASHGGDISQYVPSFVNKALGEAFEK